MYGSCIWLLSLNTCNFNQKLCYVQFFRYSSFWAPNPIVNIAYEMRPMKSFRNSRKSSHVTNVSSMDITQSVVNHKILNTRNHLWPITGGGLWSKISILYKVHPRNTDPFMNKNLIFFLDFIQCIRCNNCSIKNWILQNIKAAVVITASSFPWNQFLSSLCTNKSRLLN